MRGTFNNRKPAFGFLFLLVVFTSAEECDKTKCPGPLKYYEELNCKPIYDKEGDCCATRYDCSHLSARSADKCYAKGHEYNIGESLKDEDRSSPCDVGCHCGQRYSGTGAQFICAIVDCFHGYVNPGCYIQKSENECCGKVVCPEKPDEVFKCEVDGNTYMDGQSFYPLGTNLVCTCKEGYKGENVEPFCSEIKVFCGTELRHTPDIQENCVPVYYSQQSPRTDCSVSYRCQNNNDTIIHATNEKPSEEKSEASDVNTCKFGNLKMHVGDELNQATDYSSVCVKCVCEVPPVPTCQRLPDEVCDVTVHPDF